MCWFFISSNFEFFYNTSFMMYGMHSLVWPFPFFFHYIGPCHPTKLLVITKLSLMIVEDFQWLQIKGQYNYVRNVITLLYHIFIGSKTIPSSNTRPLMASSLFFVTNPMINDTQKHHHNILPRMVNISLHSLTNLEEPHLLGKKSMQATFSNTTINLNRAISIPNTQKCSAY